MPVLNMDTLARLRRAAGTEAPAGPADGVTMGDTGTGSPGGGEGSGNKVQDMVMKQLEKIPCK